MSVVYESINTDENNFRILLFCINDLNILQLFFQVIKIVTRRFSAIFILHQPLMDIILGSLKNVNVTNLGLLFGSYFSGLAHTRYVGYDKLQTVNNMIMDK
jgi:hypothetical protein